MNTTSTKTEIENARRWVLLTYAVWYSEYPQDREKRLSTWFNILNERVRNTFTALRHTRGFSMRVNSEGIVQFKISKGIALEAILIGKCVDRDDLEKELGQLEKELGGD